MCLLRCVIAGSMFLGQKAGLIGNTHTDTLAVLTDWNKIRVGVLINNLWYTLLPSVRCAAVIGCWSRVGQGGVLASLNIWSTHSPQAIL